MTFKIGHIYEYYSGKMELGGHILIIDSEDYLLIETNGGERFESRPSALSRIDASLWEWIDHGEISDELLAELQKKANIRIIRG